MSRALDVMQVKEDVLKFLAAGTRFGGISLDVQIEQKIYKRKSDGGTFKSEENLGGTSAGSSPRCYHWKSSRKTIQRAVLKFAAATGTTPTAGHLAPGTSLSRAGQPFRSREFRG